MEEDVGSGSECMEEDKSVESPRMCCLCKLIASSKIQRTVTEQNVELISNYLQSTEQRADRCNIGEALCEACFKDTGVISKAWVRIANRNAGHGRHNAIKFRCDLPTPPSTPPKVTVDKASGTPITYTTKKRLREAAEVMVDQPNKAAPKAEAFLSRQLPVEMRVAVAHLQQFCDVSAEKAGAALAICNPTVRPPGPTRNTCLTYMTESALASLEAFALTIHTQMQKQ
eukprot:TRINITY_DN84171_c0_g1_i1.p1 TRINITY_DN84171_c0_g1~~TRINITY_DN84171_c0_g1_i1.p1  ORF type:complete len:228 (+),score=17.88 TRINITY_DN84171_c0_g1_i1:72-755(+)